MATAKSKRTISLNVRETKVTNLNFQPEKAGDALVERADMSLEFLVADVDVDDIIDTKGNVLKVLWHTDGSPQLRELAKLEINLKAEGTATFGRDTDFMISFENAVLKKVSVKPMIDRQLAVKCQIRIDPTGHLEALAAMRIAGQCLFSFDGSGVATGDKNADQGTLAV